MNESVHRAPRPEDDLGDGGEMGAQRLRTAASMILDSPADENMPA